jgi:hypothetical protein
MTRMCTGVTWLHFVAEFAEVSHSARLMIPEGVSQVASRHYN